jgi:hypothetical protein
VRSGEAKPHQLSSAIWCIDRCRMSLGLTPSAVGFSQTIDQALHALIERLQVATESGDPAAFILDQNVQI